MGIAPFIIIGHIFSSVRPTNKPQSSTKQTQIAIAVLPVLGLLVLMVFPPALPWLIAVAVVAAGIWLGRTLDARYGRRVFFALVPTLFVVTPLLWGYVSYLEFESLCQSAPPNTAGPTKLSSPQLSFLLDEANLRAFYSSKHIRTPAGLLEQKKISYYDTTFTPAYNNFQSTTYRNRGSNDHSSRLAEPVSEYSFRVSPIEQVPSRWWGPLYQLSYSVQATRGGSVLAKGSEYIFGGGFVGVYLHAVLGERGDYHDRDYSYLSCGYASSVPAAWRPRFTSNPNSENYFRADADLLKSITF